MLRLFSIFVLLISGSAALAEPMTEKQKVDALLDSFDAPGITFIRNGEEHDGAWAKEHLKEKLKSSPREIATAEDFIAQIASSSSHSGKPYLVKTKDGKTMESAAWLKAKLAEMNSPSAGGEKQ